MQASFLKQYVELNKKLIKTIVIKSEVSADLVNSLISLKYGESSVDPLNPRSWKYYLNISGQYHITDIEMRVISLDTLDEIVFSKANLLNHVATAEAYKYGTRYYYSLVDKYPEQEQLILGILYPCDINKAIDAKNGSILSYPSELVEFQERTLISELEEYVKNYMVRWDVKAYGITDDLYAPAQLAIMYLNLIPKLINLRTKRCKTDEAHSFHIREYLASHYGLDNYLNNLTLKQAMYLYRNIRYIERNSGKIDQFKTLVDKLLTDRRIPLTEYSVRHAKTFDAEYYPDIIVRKKAINSQYNKVEKDYVSMEITFDKERFIKPGNNDYLLENDKEINISFKNSNSNAVQSKILESDMVDYSESVPDTLEDILIREWMSQVDLGFYNIIVNFKDPKTFDVRNLYIKDALIYFYYIAQSSVGTIVYSIPDFFNVKARKKDIPTIDELLSIVDIKLQKDAKPIIERIVKGQPNIDAVHSVSSFNSRCKLIYDESLYHWYLLSNIHDMELRGAIANVIEKLYYAKDIKLADGSMTSWLNMQNLPKYNYTFDEASKLLQDIFIACTGFIINKDNSLASIQKAMIGLMEKLCSYTVQFIQNINDDNIIPVNWAAIRGSTDYIKLTSSNFCPTNIRMLNTEEYISTEKLVIVNLASKSDNFMKVSTVNNIDLIHGVSTTTINGTTDEVSSYFRSLNIEVDYPEYDVNISKNAKFIGEEFLVKLPETSKKQIKSIY